jgi:hypothetical protein
MLAYVFWHRRAAGVAARDYEARLSAFHATIGVPSRWGRVSGLPWLEGGLAVAGYEDWYLVEDWAALGVLNERAVSGARQVPHDAAAAGAAWGIAGVYALKRGEPSLEGITHAGWRSKPTGVDHAVFEPTLPGRGVWQRQMTLGPTPEYVCLDAAPVDGDPAVTYS